jgi:hypothetical protein
MPRPIKPCNGPGSKSQTGRNSIVFDLRLGLVEREVLRAKGDAAAAQALTERLRRRIASHPDRALLSSYERVLTG